MSVCRARLGGVPLALGRWFVGWAVLVGLCLLGAQAHAAEPSTAECLAANERSIALRRQHALQAAREALLSCAATTCPADVRNECVLRLGEVNAQQPTIVFVVKDTHGEPLSAVSLSVDGTVVADRLAGTALPLDPGEHVLVFSAAGLPAARKRLIAYEGEKARREAVVLGEQAASASAPLATPAPAAVSGSSHTPLIVGIGLEVVGCAGLGLALYHQLLAHDRYAASERTLASPNPEVRDTSPALYDQARQAQLYAVVFAATGVVALGTGLYLVLSGLGDSAATEHAAVRPRIIPLVGPRGAGLSYWQAF
ncbi:MAG: hypothetical protein ABW321_07950 [Polyangiales bacterium]